MSIKNMWKFGFFFIVILSLSSCEPKITTSNTVLNQNYAEEIIEARNEVSIYMLLNSIPGYSFSVSHHGEIIWSEGFGYASLELETPATRNTKYRIGELSELFTSLAYRLLIEENILHPDSNVISYLTDFPEEYSKITLDYLASHKSGIRANTNQELSHDALNLTIKEGINLFKDDSLLFEPGKYQHFSMFNYNLLGAIIEEVTEKPFYQIIKEYVTDTLKLENTVADYPWQVINNRADFYNKNTYALIENSLSIDASYRLPSNGYLSTADDIVKFCNAIYFSDAIPEKIKNILFPKTSMSDGEDKEYLHRWSLITQNDNNLLGYGTMGNVPGGSAEVAIFPEQELVIACTSNVESGIDNLPVLLIANIFLLNEIEQ